MAVREYIGARYVPLFAEPAQWSDAKTYEPLTIVMNEGNSYTSRQYVPLGIPLGNENYWALTGNYNAQVEAYRKEVKALAGRTDALEKKTVYATPEQFGAVGDGVNDDTSAVQQAIDSGDPVLGAGVYKCTAPITIHGNDVATINEIVSTASVALSFLDGRYGKVFVNSVNSAGVALQFNNVADTIQGLELTVNFIESAQSCCEFRNQKGILDCTFNGNGWGCATGPGFNFGQFNTSYIGQIKMNVRRIAARTSWGIKIDTTNTLMTGIDFGYLSLENSMYGIWINWVNKGLERISGTFRTVEIVGLSNKVLKLSGDFTKQSQQIRIAFDYLQYDSVDLSDLKISLASNLHGSFVIDSPFFYGQRVLCDSSVLKSNGFKFKPIAFRSTTYTNETTFDEWVNAGITPTHIAVNSPNNVLNVPSFWDGSYPLRLVLEGQTTVNVKLNNEVTASKTLPGGRYFLFMNYDSSGNALLTAYNASEV